MLKVDRSDGGAAAPIATAPHAIAMPGAFAEEGRTSITELLNASLYALDEDLRAIFLAFGELFVPGATVELMARLTDRDESAIADALTVLHRRGLVERQTGGEGGTTFTACTTWRTATRPRLRRVWGGTGAVVSLPRVYAGAPAEVAALDAETATFGAAEHAASPATVSLVEMMLALCGPYLPRGHCPPFSAV